MTARPPLIDENEEIRSGVIQTSMRSGVVNFASTPHHGTCIGCSSRPAFAPSIAEQRKTGRTVFEPPHCNVCLVNLQNLGMRWDRTRGEWHSKRI